MMAWQTGNWQWLSIVCVCVCVGACVHVCVCVRVCKGSGVEEYRGLKDREKRKKNVNLNYKRMLSFLAAI